MPFDTYIQGNVVLDQLFDSLLNDPSSNEFHELQMKIAGPLQDLYCDPFPCCNVIITGFRQGSVIVGILTAIAKGELTDCDISSHLISQASSLPATVGGISVTPGSLAIGNPVLFF